MFQFNQQAQTLVNLPQGLPFDPRNYQWPTITLNINNLPVNVAPMQNQVESSLIPYLPSIVVATIDILQTRAIQNPLRMFLFNQLASAQYNNQNFFILLKVICDIAEYYRASGSSIESAIQSAIDISIQFAALNNLKAYPALGQYIDVNTSNSLNALDQKQNQLSIQVQGYQQQKAARQNGGFGFQQPSHFNHQNNTPFNGFAPNQPGVQNSWNNQTTGLFSTGSSNKEERNSNKMINSWESSQKDSGSWRVPETPAQQTPTWQNNTSASFKFNEPQAPQQEAPVQPARQYVKTYNHDGRTLVKQGDPGVIWKPSERWPVNISDSRFVDVYYVIHDNGDMQPIIRKLNKEEQMEKSKHINTTSYRSESSKPWDSVLVDSREDRIENAIQRFETRGFHMVSSGSHNRRNESIKDEEVVKDTTHLIITSSDEALSQTDIAMTISDTAEKPCEAYSKPALRVTPIVSKTKAEELITSLCESVSLEQCASKLKVESYDIASISDYKNKRDRLIIFGKINRMLTASVNKYLKYRLCLSDMKIDSFEEDGADITSHLEKYYPTNYATALRKHQRRIITNVLSTTKDGSMGTGLDDCVREQQLIDEDIVGTEPIFLYSKEVYMSVNEFSDVLQLNLTNPSEVISVYQDANPLLYSLCEHLISKDEDDVYTYYIKTADDVVYEVNRSALSESVFIIGLKS